MRNVTPTMVEALNIIAKTGLTEGVRATTVKALVNRELIWDDSGAWYLTSEAHDLDGVDGDAREADLARQEARSQAQFDNEASVGEPQVFQGAMHEATRPDTIGDTLRVLANSTAGIAEAFTNVGHHAREAARKLGVVAWARQVAVVRSMGHTVRGKVVDTVLRAPGANGMGRVCLVVQHDGHPTRRTLHALADVQFEALAS
jgi:hypothetical protein